MTEPFAVSADYRERRTIPTGTTNATVDIMLEDASTTMRAEAVAAGVDLDARIASGRLDVNIAMLVAVDMVAEALRRRAIDQPAGSTVQESAGPFSSAVTLPASLPDDLFLTRTMRKRLGIGQRAFSVPMYVVPS